MPKLDKKYTQIKKQLIKLQTNSQVISVDLRRSRFNSYKLLCNAYFWWRSANKIDGFLENQYKSLRIQFKKNVKDGINFSPLIRLVFGNNNLADSWVDRYSRALKAVHNEYELNPGLYCKNGVNKLANFIDQSGGTTELAGYAAPGVSDSDNDDSSGFANNSKTISDNDKKQTQKVLLALSWIFEAYSQKYLIDPPTYIKSTPNNFSVLLVQHTDEGVNIIDSLNDSKLVDSLLAENFKRRFELTLFAVRPILELIQTQCWPKHLEGIIDRLVDKTRLKDEKNAQFISHLRVLYLPQRDEFILSPMNALSVVVSIVKPYFPLLLEGCKNDVFLPVANREELESKLLRNFEFNLYNIDFDTTAIPIYPEKDSASHVVHLRHRFKKGDFLTLSFWPFYRSVQSPQDQVIIDEEYVFTPTWHALVGHHEIKRVNDNFVQKWLTSHAFHITRDPHAIIQVNFAKDMLRFSFVYQLGQFENFEEVKIHMLEVSDESVTAYFASKDLIPALKCLNDLPVIIAVAEDPSLNNRVPIEGTIIPEAAANYKGGVFFELDENVLRIQFYTVFLGGGGGEFNIFVPTVDLEGNRATKPFKRYYPQIIDDTLTSEDNHAELEDKSPEVAEYDI